MTDLLSAQADGPVQFARTIKIGLLDAKTRAVFGRSYAAEPEVLVGQLSDDAVTREADTLFLTIPNQLGVAYNMHVIEVILTTIAPALGWR